MTKKYKKSVIFQQVILKKPLFWCIVVSDKNKHTKTPKQRGFMNSKHVKHIKTIVVKQLKSNYPDWRNVYVAYLDRCVSMRNEIADVVERG